ncbi:MAG: energy-coupling factor transporter transmembrane component T, partial [Myxococcota bacterium]
PRADPRVGLSLSLAVGGFAVILDQPASLLALAAASVVGLAAAPIPARRRAAVLGAAALVMASTAWTQGLFYAGVPRTEAWAVGPLVWWREGLTHGAVQSLRLVATGIAGLAVALSTPVDRLFAGLVALAVPHGAAFLAVTALRFVPVVGEEWATVRFARARRGRPLLRRAPWDVLRQEMGMLAPLLARTIRRSRVLAESLELRGFDPGRPRRARAPLRASTGERLAVGATGLVLATLALAAALTASYTHGGWWSPALRPLYGWVRAWL